MERVQISLKSVFLLLFFFFPHSAALIRTTAEEENCYLEKILTFNPLILLTSQQCFLRGGEWRRKNGGIRILLLLQQDKRRAVRCARCTGKMSDSSLTLKIAAQQQVSWPQNCFPTVTKAKESSVIKSLPRSPARIASRTDEVQNQQTGCCTHHPVCWMLETTTLNM